MARRKPYPQEFKDEAVRMVLDGPRPVVHVARELGIHDTTLGNRIAAYKREHGQRYVDNEWFEHRAHRDRCVPGEAVGRC